MLRIMKEVNHQEPLDIKKLISKISKTLKKLKNKIINQRQLNNLMLSNHKPNKIMNKKMKIIFNNKNKNHKNKINKTKNHKTKNNMIKNHKKKNNKLQSR